VKGKGGSALGRESFAFIRPLVAEIHTKGGPVWKWWEETGEGGSENIGTSIKPLTEKTPG